MEYLLLGLLLAGASVCACVGFFRKVMRGEARVSRHAILLMLIAAILLVPFVMNVSAHLVFKMRHLQGGNPAAAEMGKD